MPASTYTETGDRDHTPGTFDQDRESSPTIINCDFSPTIVPSSSLPESQSLRLSALGQCLLSLVVTRNLSQKAFATIRRAITSDDLIFAEDGKRRAPTDEMLKKEYSRLGLKASISSAKRRIETLKRKMKKKEKKMKKMEEEMEKMREEMKKKEEKEEKEVEHVEREEEEEKEKEEEEEEKEKEEEEKEKVEEKKMKKKKGKRRKSVSPSPGTGKVLKKLRGEEEEEGEIEELSVEVGLVGDDGEWKRGVVYIFKGDGEEKEEGYRRLRWDVEGEVEEGEWEWLGGGLVSVKETDECIQLIFKPSPNRTRILELKDEDQSLKPSETTSKLIQRASPATHAQIQQIFCYMGSLRILLGHSPHYARLKTPNGHLETHDHYTPPTPSPSTPSAMSLSQAPPRPPTIITLSSKALKIFAEPSTSHNHSPSPHKLSSLEIFIAKGVREGRVTGSFIEELASLAQSLGINSHLTHHIPTRRDIVKWEQSRIESRIRTLPDGTDVMPPSLLLRIHHDAKSVKRVDSGFLRMDLVHLIGHPRIIIYSIVQYHMPHDYMHLEVLRIGSYMLQFLEIGLTLSAKKEIRKLSQINKIVSPMFVSKMTDCAEKEARVKCISELEDLMEQVSREEVREMRERMRERRKRRKESEENKLIKLLMNWMIGSINRSSENLQGYHKVNDIVTRNGRIGSEREESQLKWKSLITKKTPEIEKVWCVGIQLYLDGVSVVRKNKKSVLVLRDSNHCTQMVLRKIRDDILLLQRGVMIDGRMEYKKERERNGSNFG
ncbi:hypothetical protein ADUPG1_012919 [Aduncisulcus paluster]|uniref:Uncharacterized protein n=1 Tax=Aduncisulcus paluster TaxID=2918883 RepID=A0ABQ5K2Y6_9EUKA|nr:hypothetical protein ADUPG1_012919 [Aduncisulcus paluster]